MNFHDNKLWQEAFVALMDVHDVAESVTGDDYQAKIAEGALSAARSVAAKIADGLSRMDRRLGRQLILDTVGLVAVTRTQLAVAWGRGMMDDATFKALDDKYAALSQSLQNYK